MLQVALLMIIGVIPAVLLRWVILRRPLTTWPAVGVTLPIFVGLVALAAFFSPEPSGITGAANAGAALLTFNILKW